MRTLHQLLGQRRGLVADKVRITNRLTTALKQYFPQVLDWFKDKDTRLFCDFLTRWPTLKHAQRARKTRLLAAFGEQRERYSSAAEIQRYVGIAPVTEHSGHTCWVHWRLQCPTFLRQTFVDWAAQSIPHGYWAARYYQQQRTKGAAHQVALRALAFKWIRILYRCWKDRTPDDEATYLNALKRRGSPLLT
jgi:Transposase IS116/IS110/IS902 family